MHTRNRVIWNEGLFIKPQHFQQQQRHIDYCIEQQINAISRYSYGVSELSINTEYLPFGKIAIERVSGIMPDGTVFRIPLEDEMPDALEIEDASLSNQLVYLAIPLKCESIMEVDWPEKKGSGRYVSYELEVRDIQSPQGDMTNVNVAPVRMQLKLEKDDRSAFASIAIARIMEKRPDGSVVLDDDFIPCHLNVAAIAVLHRFINELSGLVRERAKNIARRLGQQGQGSVAEVSDFMLLQVLNRVQPQLEHKSRLKSLHPEKLYESLVSLSGELASFTDESRLPSHVVNYDHDMPGESFWPLIYGLRRSLSVVLEPRAVSIQLEKRKYGLMVAPVNDSRLVQDGEFIIAVRAKMPLEELRKLFVQQTKVSSVDRIRELVSLQLPGVPLIPLPVAPRHLPYHAGYTYYQLNKESSEWRNIEASSGFALHISARFEELDIQFWAIRS
ncbi:type VI secretion system baseplate subunit TssK [Vibrio sp. JC009]|uniref:type VI secretion system baseplate subunit TssK n=1 Tax=Vibrio sp. JC009 TaxID=2912314 RepID=UPI0023B13F58|nr:type VI secretion system baseplate subunit TssK [Vibrio sp. JC009]WED24551.1 type VI secretion system baseplate subunit TssK [Vibrio sp. JC009]